MLIPGKMLAVVFDELASGKTLGVVFDELASRKTLAGVLDDWTSGNVVSGNTIDCGVDKSAVPFLTNLSPREARPGLLMKSVAIMLRCL